MKKKKDIHNPFTPYYVKINNTKIYEKNWFLFINILLNFSLSNNHLENPQLLSSHSMFSEAQEKTEGKFPQLMQKLFFFFFFSCPPNKQKLPVKIKLPNKVTPQAKFITDTPHHHYHHPLIRNPQNQRRKSQS